MTIGYTHPIHQHNDSNETRHTQAKKQAEKRKGYQLSKKPLFFACYQDTSGYKQKTKKANPITPGVPISDNSSDEPNSRALRQVLPSKTE